MRPRLASSFALLALVLLPLRAAAQGAPEGPTPAQALATAADDLLARGLIAEACPKYGESYRLAPDVGVLLRFADCLERDGQLGSAHAAFLEAGAMTTLKGDPRAEMAQRRAQALEPRVSRVEFELGAVLELPGLEVLLDGAPVPRASLGSKIAVDAGDHRALVRAPGYESWSTSFAIQGEGASEVLVVSPLRPAPGTLLRSARPAPLSPSTRTAKAPLPTQEIVGFAVGGSGIVGLTVAAIFGVERGSKLAQRDEICPSANDCASGTNAHLHELTEQARRAQTAALVSLVAGGAATVAGIALVLTAPRHAHAAQARVRVFASAMPAARMLGLEGAF
jgi:hypothetical protein